MSSYLVEGIERARGTALFSNAPYPDPKEANVTPRPVPQELDLGETGTYVRALVKLGTPSTAALIELLNREDPDRNLRKIAAIALGEIGPAAKEAVPHLIERLKRAPGQSFGGVFIAGDPDPKKRSSQPLGLRPPYLQGTDDRKYYVKALADIGPPSIPALADVLKDNEADRDLQRTAAMALGEIGPAAKDAIPALFEWRRKKKIMTLGFILFTLVKIGEAAVPHLIQGLDDEDKSVQYLSAKALGKIGAREAVPALQLRVNDESKSSSVRASIAEALRKIQQGRAP